MLILDSGRKSACCTSIKILVQIPSTNVKVLEWRCGPVISELGKQRQVNSGGLLDNQWNRLGKLKVQQEIMSQNTEPGMRGTEHSRGRCWTLASISRALFEITYVWVSWGFYCSINIDSNLSVKTIAFTSSHSFGVSGLSIAIPLWIASLGLNMAISQILTGLQILQ